MRVENVNFNSINSSTVKHQRQVADVDEIKAILFLSIKSDIPVKDPKRMVDIII